MIPNAVVKEQPSIAANTGEVLCGIVVTLFSETIEYSLKVVTLPLDII